jgi:hypothetical protein
MKLDKTEVFICDCGSLDHTYAFWYDTEFNDVHFMPHLMTHRNFFKRVIIGIKYMFGYKSRYGDFDSTIINPEDIKKIRKYFDKSEVEYFLNYNHKVREVGMDVFEDIDDLSRWLLEFSDKFNGRVIDQPVDIILDELGRIEHAIF